MAKTTKKVSQSTLMHTETSKVFKRKSGEGSFLYAKGKTVFGESLINKAEKIPADSDLGFTTEGIIPPPENPEILVKLPKKNNVLLQCISSMVANIESPGQRYSFNKSLPLADKDSLAAKAELDALRFFTENPNPESTLTEIREIARQDLETLGYAFIEVVRNAKGNVTQLYNVRSYKYRLIKLDSTSTSVPVTFKIPSGADNKKPNKTTFDKFYRKYAYVPSNGQYTYYKEFGDPRILNSKTGKYVSSEEPVPENLVATELIHMSIYDPDNLYGSPRYINNIPAILGSRECELTNFQFFKENAVPNMAVLLSGGFLTEGSVKNLQSFLTAVKGRESMQRIIVLEATGDQDAASDDGKVHPPRMNIQMLGNERQNDEQFQNYDTNNRRKIQSSFRLPDILIGLSTDYSRNTADSAKAMAESQVFMPERARVERLFNTKILPAVVYGRDATRLKYWEFKANPPRIASEDGLTKLFTTLNLMGAITSNIAIDITNEVLGTNIPLSDKPWANIPFPIVQSLANANNLAGVEEVTKVANVAPAPVKTNPKGQ